MLSFFRSVLPGLALCAACVCAVFPLYAGGAEAVDPEARPVKPFRGITYSAEDIVQVRHAVRDRQANAEMVAKVLEVADEWVGRDEAVIAELIPAKDAVFAYGSIGDPKVNKPWPRFAAAEGMCSLDLPGQVRSPHTGDVYGIQKEGEEFYDSGSGWVRAADGHVFYFKGVWNSWVMDQLHAAVDNLALAYMLTGEPEYANRALFILDRLATLRVQLPVLGYSVADWPHKTAADDKKGFFRYMGNHANQRTINTVLAFDLVGAAPYAANPSAGDPSLSIADNIISNYFDIYEYKYLDPLRQLTNHASILIANILMQGVLLGDPELLQEGIDSLYAFLDNTINRDGDYVEVSGSYGRLGRDYGSRIIAALTHYNPNNYPNGAQLPKPADYPFGLNFGNDPRWYENAVRMLYRLPILGRYPQYGDMTGDRLVLLDEDNMWLARHRIRFLRLLYQQTTRPEWKSEIEVLYDKAKQQNNAAPMDMDDLLLYGASQWIEPAQPEQSAELELPGQSSDLMGGKGIAILRSGQGANARALFMRGGVNSYHGHDDQMALFPYGDGMMLAGEYGYRWAGTPDHLGWGTRSISHLSAVVDEDLPAPYLYKGYPLAIPAPAASVSGFLRGGQFPAQLIEMTNPALYTRANLEDYRRTAWLVDVSEQDYYFVDMFRIVGGKTHDYAWNAPYGPRSRRVDVSGVTPRSVAGVWTLASVSGKHRDAEWNKPKQSWGERLNGELGRVDALPGGQRMSTSRWNPEPGNGYGMIWDVKLAPTKDNWQATWGLQDQKNSMRARLVNLDGMTAMTALAPSLRQSNPFNMIVARRTQAEHGGGKELASRFVNVVDIAEGEDRPVVSAEALRIVEAKAAEDSDVIALKVALRDGAADYFLSTRLAGQAVNAGVAQLAGRNGFVRVDANSQVRDMALLEGTYLGAGGFAIETAAAAFEGEILSVLPGRESDSKIEIRGDLPTGNLLAGMPVFIRGSKDAKTAYAHDEYYEVETVEAGPQRGTSTLVFHDQSLIYTQFIIDKVDSEGSQIELYWINELASKPGTLSYQGRALIAAGSARVEPVTHVEHVNGRKVKLESVRGLKAGQKLQVMVTQPGDRVVIPTSVKLQRADEANTWLLTATTPVTLTFPPATGATLTAQAQGAEPVAIVLGKNADGSVRAVINPAQLGSSHIILRFE